MRFQVPQFIETQTKIVGPFTLKQFLFLATGAIIIFVLQFAITNLVIFIIASLPIAAIFTALAFYKINDIPLPQYLIMALTYLTGSKRYHFTKNEEPQYFPE